MHFFLPRQMFRQRTPRRFLDERLHGSRTLGGADTFVLVQFIELQFKLLDLAGNLLRGLSELQPPQLGNPRFQLGDLQPLRFNRARKLPHQRLKRGCVRWQVGEIDLHAGDHSGIQCDPPLRTVPRVQAATVIRQAPVFACVSGLASRSPPADSQAGPP